MVGLAVAFFMNHKHRSKETFEALVNGWQGILVSDGYRLYQNWVNKRQTCLSHLIRKARALSPESRFGTGQVWHLDEERTPEALTDVKGPNDAV
nr:transposase [Desulfonatronum thioautotrophicum]